MEVDVLKSTTRRILRGSVLSGTGGQIVIPQSFPEVPSKFLRSSFEVPSKFSVKLALRRNFVRICQWNIKSIRDLIFPIFNFIRINQRLKVFVTVYSNILFYSN
jgi:hypothetical protein